MIKLEDVNKYYNSNGVISTGLRHINIELNKNEIVAITGESGGGKSTLLNVITKMDTFDDGEIYYYGNETSYFNVNDMDQFRKNKIGFIFQNYNIIDSYTVLENVMLPLTLKGFTRKEAKEKAISLIEKVGLKDRIKNRGTKLSGGEKQRCVIARALASDCEILACDEPTGNLDSETGMEIIKLIKEVAKDKLVLIVTHNYEQVKDIATRKIVVADGEITEDRMLSDLSIKDEEKDINLDYEPIPYKTTAVIARNNLAFTPRKTFLTCIVFFCISLFALILYQAIYYTNNDGLSYYNNFKYKGDNKVLVYNLDRKPLDKEKLDKIKGEKVYNLFYQTTGIQTDFYKNIAGYNSLISSRFVTYEREVKNLQLDLGRLPVENDECVLLIPNYYYDIDQFLDSTATIQTSIYNVSAKFKVVGIQQRDDVQDIVITCCEGVENFLIAEPYLRLRGIYEHTTYNVDIEIVSTGESYLNMPSNYEDYKFSENLYTNPLNLYGLETFDLFDMRIDPTADKVTLHYSLEDKINQDVIYEAAIYGNVDKITRQLDDLGYEYLIPAKYDTSTKLEFYINNLTSYALMIFASLSLVIVYIITYIILSKIYQSKKKDYTILRTLGVTKGDMKHIVSNEVMIQTIIISIVSYFVVFILGKTVDNALFKMFANISLFSTILYFIVMMIFGYFIGRRFNRKLFKFSVNKTFKSEVAKND